MQVMSRYMYTVVVSHLRDNSALSVKLDSLAYRCHRVVCPGWPDQRESCP